MIMPLLREMKKPGVVFSHEYYNGMIRTGTSEYFDPLKFKKIRDLLIARNLVRRKKVLIPRMATYEEMALVHTKAYLKKIQDPPTVGRLLNITGLDIWDSHILEFFRIVTGGTLLATKYAIEYRTAAFNLGGGFHHARSERAAGFCLINDVAIAIRKFRQKTSIRRILIIDLDYHEGDGNLDIFSSDEDVYTFSMHASDWHSIEKPNNRDILLPDGCGFESYWDILTSELPVILTGFSPELVFYIAGSDVHELDTLGDMTFTREEILKRNMYVYDLVSEKNLPLIIVAGGGYGPDSWMIYYDFIASAMTYKR